ncbi:MAG: CPBP family intramembrane metalloprotease [Lachnospiraceae bacterium]|nr:CPBP family intramembrane metalloprotease [Lachnospiraceae bacterium]
MMMIIIITVGLSIGQITAYVLFSGITDGGWNLVFTFYLPFIIVDLILIGYLFFVEKPIFHSLKHEKHKGRSGNNIKMALLGLLIGFVLNILCAFIAMLNGDLHFSFMKFDPLFLIVSLAFVCIQSGTEELLYRGYGLSAIKERYNMIFAILLNPVIFSLIHIVNPGVKVYNLVTIFVIGVCFGIMTVVLDSIWFPVMLHTAWNFTQNIILGLPNSGIVCQRSLFTPDAVKESLFYDVEFGLEGGMPVNIVFPIVTAVIVLIVKRRKER